MTTSIKKTYLSIATDPASLEVPTLSLRREFLSDAYFAIHEYPSREWFTIDLPFLCLCYLQSQNCEMDPAAYTQKPKRQWSMEQHSEFGKTFPTTFDNIMITPGERRKG